MSQNNTFFGLIIIAVLVFAGCEKPKYSMKDMEQYTGPIMVVDSLDGILTDSARLKAHLVAGKQLRYENRDEEFPAGFKLEFYDDNGEIESIMSGDSAFFENVVNVWHAYGNVVVENVRQHKVLKTEELHWKPKDEQIETDKFVTIRTPDQILSGTGLIAKDDFSEYEIQNITGTFQVE